MNRCVFSVFACALFAVSISAHADADANANSRDPVAGPDIETHDWPRLVGAMTQEPALRWDLAQGESLREQLTAWTDDAGWTLVWRSPWDYPVAAPAHFEGSFVEAVTELMVQMNASGSTLGAKLMRGNRVLLITENR